MFKLESYVTPLLLSYVDKYIKNLKPEDSQLSLWGGDAVFTNLDLRLDVLEQELNLPFSFINGHIHELRIHVPWTRLGSEPVIITINTIECILKLRAEDDSASDGSSKSVASGAAQKSRPESTSRKRIRRQEGEEVPPSYVQSLINRVLNNISVVCNNLILKYVEDDIVLSLNIKSAEFFSVDESWERSFSDLNPESPVLRKVISMQDLTVCLDKRDASGKIETYQDPLLYRCSASCRIYMRYDVPHMTVRSITRIHLFCDSLDFSITDQQLPMFLRLLQLCLALYYNEFGETSKVKRNSFDGSGDELTNPDQIDNITGDGVSPGDVSWGSWVWSYVPQILPDWKEEDSEYASGASYYSSSQPRVFQFGVFVNKATCIFKLTESVRETSSYFGQPKLSFQPLAAFFLSGAAVEVTTKNADFVNVQMGVTSISLATVGDCICGIGPLSEAPEKRDVIFMAGSLLMDNPVSNFHSSSLFDPHAPENLSQQREYIFDWEKHLECWNEKAMLHKYPALAIDYIYELEIPEEWSDRASSITATFLENSNWHERAFFRMIFGQSVTDVTSSFIHRLEKFFHCAQQHEYPPYSSVKTETGDKAKLFPTLEDLESLEEFVPSRSYQLTLMKPMIRIHMANHPVIDVSKPQPIERKKKRHRSKQDFGGNSSSIFASMETPVLTLFGDCVTAQISKPMYPQRLIKITSAIASPPSNLMHHSHLHLSIKLFGFEIFLSTTSQIYMEGLSVLPPCSIAFFRKSLLLPESWQDHPSRVTEENWAEAPKVTICLTKPQLLAIVVLAKSWWENKLVPQEIVSAIMKDMVNKDKPVLSFELGGIDWHSVETSNVIAYSGSVNSVTCSIHCKNQKVVLLNAPESGSVVLKNNLVENAQDFSNKTSQSSRKNWLEYTAQIMKDHTVASEPSVLLVQLQYSAVCLDLSLMTWLSYQPQTNLYTMNPLFKQPPSETKDPDVAGDTTSTTTPSASQSYSIPLSPLASTWEKMKASSLDQDSSEAKTQWATYLFFHSRLFIMQVSIHGCSFLIPSLAWAVPLSEISTGCISLLPYWKEAIASGSLNEAVIVCLPTIKVTSAGSKNNDLPMKPDLPITSLEGWNAGAEKFPWNISLQEGSIYTLHKNAKTSYDTYYILKPTTVSSTLGVTTKCSATATDLSSLGVCIHADFQPLFIQCSQIQVSLLMDILIQLLGAVHSIRKTSNFILMLGESCPPGGVAVAPPPLLSMIPNQFSHTSSSQMEAGHDFVSEVPDTSEQASVQQTATSKTAKITLWLQVTLPKLGLSLLAEEHKEEIKIEMEIEDFMTSLDIQEVYSKVKAKFNSMNIHCFKKRERSSHWIRAPAEGIIFSCSQKLTPNIFIVCPKAPDNRTPSFPVPPDARSKGTDSFSHAFLTFTYTRALVMNVQKKWAAFVKEHTPSSGDDDPAQTAEEKQTFNCPEKYISEIELKINSFDVVLLCPLVRIVYSIFLPLQNVYVLLSQRKWQTPTSSIPAPKLWNFNHNNLPLVYLNTSNIRIFVPEVCPAEQNGSSTEGDRVSSKEKKRNGDVPDTCILQIGSIILVPQAENPLSRIVLRRDFYLAAQRSRTIGIPGAAIEDRQYQLDISSFSFSTASWQDIAHMSREQLQSPPLQLSTLGENPALEWNNKVLHEEKGSEEDEIVAAVPVMSQFDMRIIVAPAVVYKKHTEHQRKQAEEILVCGHSVEVNVTSDFGVYLSLRQLQLIHRLVTKNLMEIFTVPERDNSSLEDGSHLISRASLSDLIRDSGIDSEDTTARLASQSPLSLFILKSLYSERKAQTSFVPFELLVTGCSVSMTLYHDDPSLIPLRKSSMKGKIVHKKKTHKRSQSYHNLSPSQDSEERVGPIQLPKYLMKSPKSSRKKKVKMKKKVMHPKDDSSSASSHGLAPKSMESSSTCTFTGLFSEDGYDGSEDSCSEMEIRLKEKESDSNESRSSKRDHPRVVPCIYVCISQPHTFISCHPSKQKIETSCFDIQVKGTHSSFLEDIPILPAPSDFTASWVITRPGEVHPKTGIPPALVTMTLTDFLHRPANVKFQLERPLKINLNVMMLEQLQALYSTIDQLLFSPSPEKQLHDGKLSSASAGDKADEPLSHDVAADKSDSSQLTRHMQTLKHMLRNASKLELSCVQTVLALESSPEYESTRLYLSTNAIKGEVGVVPETAGEVQEVNTNLSLQGVFVKVGPSDHMHRFIGPFSFEVTCRASWESWHICAPLPAVRLRVTSDVLYVNLTPEQLKYFSLLIKQVQALTLALEQDKKISGENVQPRKHKVSKTKLRESSCQEFVDDLRKGTFQYIQDNDCTGIQPKPYDIVFSKNEGTMMWCYPQPRALTRVDVFPVPYHPSSIHSGAKSPQVQCSLQYWNAMKNCFVTCCEFYLSESASTSLDMPLVSKDTCHMLAISDLWRVVLNCKFGDFILEDTEPTDIGVLSPMALAACMKIDSCFDPSLLPSIQLSLNISLCQLTFGGKLHGKATPSKLSPFVSDDRLPREQEFGHLTFENPSFTFEAWQQKWKGEMTLNVGCDLMEYRCLTMHPVIEPVDIQSNVIFSINDCKTPILDTAIIIHPLFMKLNQSVLHTLNIMSQVWSQSQKDDEALIIPQHYIICNNTDQTFCFGQVGTDESIALVSRQMHAYSWRSHKAVQMIHISLRVMGQKWCEAFSIDTPGIFTRAVTHRGVSSTLVIKVVQLSSVQFQVVIFGQFLLSNQLTQSLEVQLLARRMLKPFKVLSLVEPMSSLPGFVVDLSRIIAIRVRLQGIDTPWSDDVAISKDEPLKPQLVKIPLKGSNQYLSAWCESVVHKASNNTKFCIVTFSPPFVIRNHLPRTLLAHLSHPDDGELCCVEVNGKGQDHQLVTFNDPAVNHKLCFQMGPGMKMSSPSIDLSTSLVDTMEREECAAAAEKDVNDLYYWPWLANQSFCWPYDDSDVMKDFNLLKDQGFLISDNVSRVPSTVVKPELPDVELQVSLDYLWPHCNTILIDVKPSVLLVNRTGADLYLVETNKREWKIPNGSTFTPPNLQDTFYFGVVWSGELYLSDPLQSSNDDWTVYRAHPKVKGIVPKVGQVNVSIRIKKNNANMICCHVVNSKEFKGIRVITVFPAFCLANHTEKADLLISLSAVPKGSRKINSLSATNHCNVKSKICSGNAVQPLLFWDVLPNDKKDNNLNELEEFQHFIQFSSKGMLETAHMPGTLRLSSFPLSQPLCLSQPVDCDQRLTVSVPRLQSSEHGRETWCSEPLVLTRHVRNGVNFLTLCIDPFPVLKIYNSTNFTLLFGESVEHTEKGITVFEEKDWHGYLPCVPPHSETYYSFPSVALKFPDSLDSLPLIHLAQQPSKCDPDYELLEFWSVPVDTRTTNDQFVYVPDAGDVKIHKERVGHTLHMFIDPVSRVEVSAKEIRSRIGSALRSYTSSGSAVICEGSVEAQATANQSQPQLEEVEVAEEAIVATTALAKIPVQRKKSRGEQQPFSREMVDPYSALVVYSSLTFSHVCLVICDSMKPSGTSEEILRVSLDNIVVNFRPGPLDFHMGKVTLHGIRHSQHELTLCVANVQVDNQMLVKDGGFDFHVILTQQQNPSKSKLESPREMRSTAWLSKAKSCSTISMEIVFETVASKYEEGLRGFVINKLNITVQPLSLFLEDVFCYSISDFYSSLFPTRLHKQLKLQPVDLYLPEDVSTIAKTLVHPMRIQHFHIAPLSMLVSLHASLKIYLSLDNSPLDFMAYDQEEVFTTSYRFGQLLTIHYLSGALLRAGWVVGSLDLIGNPTGLVRAIKSGITDFFFLPYHGLFRGPRAFVLGIAHGTVSLLCQISSGTLRSLTNLATSVSRNMDRLSLDADHWSRQEELRRQQPQGLTTGLAQGLSSFGVSLLGAIAGIVDQPMRTLVSPTSEDTTTGLRAAELVAGVGKGLVGVVTKPIGGAAELVSQTGHALLHGAGWGKDFVPRYKSTCLCLSNNSSSHQRLISKVFYGLSSSEALMCIEVTCQNTAGDYVTNILFLTPDVLCVASKSDDVHQQTFLVTEVNCYGSDTDQSLIYLVSKQKPGSFPLEDQEEANDRIADYIQQYSGTVLEDLINKHDLHTPEGQTFYVHPKLRNTFIMLFDMAQKRAQGRGFAV